MIYYTKYDNINNIHCEGEKNMGFFDLFKKKETNTKKVLIAPITGDVVPLDTVKDETFA